MLQAKTTVTVTILSGGDKINVVPDHALLRADVRAFTAGEFERVEQAAARIAASPAIDGVTIASTLERNFPPWPRTASTDDLVARANRLYGELGRTITGVSIGSSQTWRLPRRPGRPP
jgi:glutamate carboxypeptidase